jgi:hypothetical protein
MQSMSIDKIRDVIVKIAREMPSTGPQYIERINRIRRWMLDLADTMVPIYAAVSASSMELNIPFIEHTIGLAKAEAERPYDEYATTMQELRQAVGQIALEVREAFHSEEQAEYSPAYSASRAALQAIHYGVSGIGDFDIFSLAAKASLVAEQCALAEAYNALAIGTDREPVATRQVAKALSAARKEIGISYWTALHTRIYDNIPGIIDLERRRECAAASIGA